MPSTTRRAVLGALAAGSAAALAGCSSSCPDSGEPEPDALVQFGRTRPFDGPPDTGWPMPGFDAGRTGYTTAAPPEPPLAVRWRRRLPTGELAETGDRASAPVVADGRVLVATADGVSALRFADGGEAWRAPVTPNVSTPPYAVEGAVVAPVVGPGGTVYAAARDALVALDAADGSERWRHDLPAGPNGPVVAEGAVHAVVGGRVVALDPADGTELWSAAVDAGGRPAVADGAVVVGGEAGTVALESASGERRWTSEVRPEYPPVATDGVAYVGGFEGLHAVDLASGERRWTFERGSGRSISSPVVAGDTLYVVEQPGEAGDATFALDAADGAPEPRWCSEVGQGAVAAAAAERAFGLLGGGPSVEGGGSLRLVAFDERLGDGEWGLTADERLRPPAVVDGAVVTVDRAGTVRAVGAA